MSLESLKITKTWKSGNDVEEADFNAITDPVVAWATRTNNNLKQLGLDINGSSYSFNNEGRATQTKSLVERITVLEGEQPGFKNLALDLSTTGTIELVSADGSDLSAANYGIVNFNSESSPGAIASINVEANISFSIIGCHWGLGGEGDFSDVVLWVYLINDGGSVRLGVSKDGGRSFIADSDDVTTSTNATSSEKIMVDTALTGDRNCVIMAWMKANFDDTGNAGGEDHWTVQTGAGDINLGPHQAYFSGSFEF